MVQLFKGSNRRESTVVRDLNLLAGCRRARRLLAIAQRLTGPLRMQRQRQQQNPHFFTGERVVRPTWRDIVARFESYHA